MNYCRRCGGALTAASPTAFTCENDHTVYANPAPTVGIFLFDQAGKLLLGVRGIEPNKGTLDTPGGFIDHGETLEQGLAREIKEELGLTPDDYSTPVYLTSTIWHYRHAGEDLPVLSSLFYAHMKPGAQPVANDDVSDLKWLMVEDVDPSDIGNGDIRNGFTYLHEQLAGGHITP